MSLTPVGRAIARSVRFSNEPLRLMVTPRRGGLARRIATRLRGRVISCGLPARSSLPTVACCFSAARWVPPTAIVFMRRPAATLRGMARMRRILLCPTATDNRKSLAFCGVFRADPERNAEAGASAAQEPGPQRGDLVERVLELLESAARVANQNFPVPGGLHSTGMPNEQFDAERLFELAQQLRRGGLRDVRGRSVQIFERLLR